MALNKCFIIIIITPHLRIAGRHLTSGSMEFHVSRTVISIARSLVYPTRSREVQSLGSASSSPLSEDMESASRRKGRIQPSPMVDLASRALSMVASVEHTCIFLTDVTS